ncbi:MAG: redox-sensing transcriptional repressor Rex [Clostridiales bacterium]|jgi:redox-sensing transcriptional repressor|nr:redox-sensing transcriptional repressor Rex [Clostridiales bacterium]
MAVIKRLPRYYRYLGELQEDGITRVSSLELSRSMNVTASQIRQDLNNFGCFGQQGYGYSVPMLLNEIKNILGLNNSYQLIIIGAGNLGQALAAYENFNKRGFKFVALFDVNPDLVGKTIKGFKVYHVDNLENFVNNNHVDIAVFSLPQSEAQHMVKRVCDLGIKGVWNFSHMDLQVNKLVSVENVHLTDSLMTLAYKLNKGN